MKRINNMDKSVNRQFQNENILQAIVTAFPDPVFIIDNEGRYLQFLGGNERMLYDSGQYLVGKKIHDVLPEQKADLFLSAIRSAIKQSRLLTIEYFLFPSDFTNSPMDGPHGKQWFEARIAPLSPESDLPPSVIVLVINITDRKQNEEELKRLSITDPLTGTNNRRFVIQSIAYELQQIKRHRCVSSVMIIDIDNFKMINDTFGHQCGDETIINIVKLIECNIRKCDVLGRLGGDEFAILLKNTDINQAATVAEKLLNQINNAPLEYDTQKILTTISIGCSTISPDDTSLEDVINRADQALYEAKENGRNRYALN